MKCHKCFYFFIYIIFFFSSIYTFAQNPVSMSYYVNGAWGPWKTEWGENIYGNYSCISLHRSGRHPSDFIWRLTIHNFYTPRKTKDWIEYDGTIEYYISDQFPNAKSQFLYWNDGFCVDPYYHDTSKGDMPCIKKTSNATIRVKFVPYYFKKRAKVYNVFFDGVGMAIDLGNNVFKL